jgi:hypothetical protein
MPDLNQMVADTVSAALAAGMVAGIIALALCALLAWATDERLRP